MKEMELKVRIKDKNKFVFIKNLLKEKNCKWSEPCLQEDIIFERRLTNIAEECNGSEPVFRIRKLDNEYILTMKQLEADKNTAEELEVSISNVETMEQILFRLGYIRVCRLKKRRKTTVYQEYTICLDEVEELGTFLEIEKLSPDSTQKYEVYAGIMNLLKEWKIDEADIENEKYYQLLMRQNRS